MPALTLKDTWLIQDGSLNNGNIPQGCYFFIEYGSIASDPLADRQMNLVNIGATTYDMTQSLLHYDGTFTLVFEDTAIARSSLESDLKSFPIYSNVTQLDSSQYAATAVSIGGTP